MALDQPVRRIIIPYDDLKAIGGEPERYYELFKDIQVALSVLSAQAPNGAKLLNADAGGSLQVTLAGQVAAGLTEIGVFAGSGVLRLLTGQGDGQSPVQMLPVTPYLFNNVSTWDRPRSATASALATQRSLGAALASNPGEWAVSSAPAGGIQASATQAAGAAGIRHVLKSFGFSAASTVAPALTLLAVNVRDGATGAGTILKSYALAILAAAGQNVPPFEVTGLNIVGSAATAMTVEFSALLASLSETCDISGYDAA